MRLGEDGLDDALSGIDSDAEEVAWVRWVTAKHRKSLTYKYHY